MLVIVPVCERTTEQSVESGELDRESLLTVELGLWDLARLGEHKQEGGLAGLRRREHFERCGERERENGQRENRFLTF